MNVGHRLQQHVVELSSSTIQYRIYSLDDFFAVILVQGRNQEETSDISDLQRFSLENVSFTKW